MANIMSQLKLKNNISRNAFDLSRKKAFTAKVGELLPVACIECIPGDRFNIKNQHFTRTMPVNTAAYTRIREYYDWFFVPTNLLWNKFNTFITQMTDNNQHATSITSSQVLTDGHPYMTVEQVTSYLMGLYSGAPSSPLRKNEVGFASGPLTAKLLEYLGYGNYYGYCTSDTPTNVYNTNANLNPFPLLAYQKIYADYFRNSQWENAYAPSFNIDYINGSSESLNIPISSITSYSTTGNKMNMFDLRYCNWNKDLFMGVMSNSQYGDSASISNPTDNFYGTGLHTINPSSSSRSVIVPAEDTGVYAGSQNYDNVIKPYFNKPNLQSLADKLGLNILALRQAEAKQRWSEITQSQQQDYKNQIEAHFGVSMSDAYSERCRYVGGSVSTLDISEVTNTNLTDNSAAEIAGKGVGVGEGKTSFSTDVHGYLMCIYHAVPLLDYVSDGIERMCLKTKVTDYAIPEFDKTGMVQVPSIELTNMTSDNPLNVSLLGYAPRYYDYKTAVDKVNGAFINGGLGSWVAPIDSTYINRMLSSLGGTSSVPYRFFKVHPSILNPIFIQDADENNSTDQLLVNSNFDITAVRNLDRNGLPY